MILVGKNGLCANHQSFGEINFRLNLTYHYPGSDIFSQCQVVFILRSVQLIFNKYHVTIKGDSICHTKAFFRWHMLINRIAFTPYLNKSNFNLPHKSDFATQKIMCANLSDWLFFFLLKHWFSMLCHVTLITCKSKYVTTNFKWKNFLSLIYWRKQCTYINSNINMHFINTQWTHD